MVTINVKWGTKLATTVEIDPAEKGSALKERLAELTNVPLERQKVLGFQGGLLKNDAVLGDVGLKEGMKVMLVGIAAAAAAAAATTNVTTAAGSTAGQQTTSSLLGADGPPSLEAPAAAAAARPVFLEDLPTDQASKVFDHPAGLENLGNTCYMNAVLQLLNRADRAVEEIRKLPVTAEMNADGRFIEALKAFFGECAKERGGVVSPYALVAAVRARWPQFATQVRSGEGFAQQDAEEFLSAMLQTLFERSSDLEKLFGFNTEEKLICKESKEESVRAERNRILSCFTTGVKPVDNMMQGIHLSLNEDLEKHSETLGRNAVFTRTTRLDSLPEYLLVKFVRFEWKAANSLQRTESSKTKVCRRIQYPMELDVFEIASDGLKKELLLPRQVWAVTNDPARKRPRTSAEPAAEEDGEEELTVLSAGHYELIASVSHRGRTADSGHYVGWTSKTAENWLKFDDANVSEVRIRDVDMSGGRSDYHISVVLLYQRRDFEATAVDVARAVESYESV